MEKLYHYMSIYIFIQGKQGLSPRSGQEPKKGGNFSHLTTSLPLTLLPFSRYGGRRGMVVSIP